MQQEQTRHLKIWYATACYSVNVRTPSAPQTMDLCSSTIALHLAWLGPHVFYACYHQTRSIMLIAHGQIHTYCRASFLYRSVDCAGELVDLLRIVRICNPRICCAGRGSKVCTAKFTDGPNSYFACNTYIASLRQLTLVQNYCTMYKMLCICEHYTYIYSTYTRILHFKLYSNPSSYSNPLPVIALRVSNFYNIRM